MKHDEVVYTYMKSPHGAIQLARTEAGLTSISFMEGTKPVQPDAHWQRDDSALVDATDQLRAYFYGSQESFDLPLAPRGTSFQLDVWNALRSIPNGETTSYADIARKIGRPKAVRAVGAANGRNPLPIVIPCHRVIGKNGKLVGYAGGLTIKASLLAHERKHFGHGESQLLIA